MPIITSTTPRVLTEPVVLLKRSFSFIGREWKALFGFYISSLLFTFSPFVLALLIYSVTKIVALNEVVSIFLTYLASAVAIAGVGFMMMSILSMKMSMISYIHEQKSICGYYMAYLVSRKMLGYFALSLLIGLSVVVGTIFLIIPGILAAFLLSFAAFYYVLDNQGVVNSMKLSARVIWNNFRAVVFRAILGLLIFAALLILSILFNQVGQWVAQETQRISFLLSLLPALLGIILFFILIVISEFFILLYFYYIFCDLK